MFRVKRILAAVDFSDGADRALELAADLARRFEAELHLVHALNEVAFAAPAIGAPGVAMPPGWVDSWRESAGEALKARAQRVGGDGLRTKLHVPVGPPDVVICDLAESLGADLVVMATRGRSGLSRALLGSVSERTLRNAPCPVLTLNAADDGEQASDA